MGLVGKSFGLMTEATYGLRIGPMDLRLGGRTTEVIGAKTKTKVTQFAQPGGMGLYQ